MSRAPFVLLKSVQSFSRGAEFLDTTIEWPLINPAMETSYGDDTMPQTAQNVADD